MCLLLDQMELVIKAIEDGATQQEKNIAISLMALILTTKFAECDLKTPDHAATFAAAPEPSR